MTSDLGEGGRLAKCSTYHSGGIDIAHSTGESNTEGGKIDRTQYPFLHIKVGLSPRKLNNYKRNFYSQFPMPIILPEVFHIAPKLA
jgi:hypothetical protein